MRRSDFLTTDNRMQTSGRRPGMGGHTQRRYRRAIARRLGSVFHYYMMYMLFTTVLISTAGLSLHMIMKVDGQDDQIAQHVRTLLKVNQTLRTDAAAGIFVSCDPGELILKSQDSTFTWTVQDRVITRLESDQEGDVSSQRFIFHRGTGLQFSHDASHNIIDLIVSVIPEAMAGNEMSDSRRDTAEMLIHVHPDGTQISQVASTGLLEGEVR